ncbi:MAG: flagellar M-ring protein FliF [Spirochaetaceae bacterium]|jgi:flagellar M-ring protein FliF|nr:flagellar M-ring protein FliF [Spirochaetaceae bacterium]
MNEWLKKLFTQIKALWSKWTLVQKLILIGIVVAAVVALILVLRVSGTPTSVPLFDVPITDEAMRDRILFRINQENINPSINSANIITVPTSADARRMRAILVREDMVPGNVDPWNLFDTERWTTTDFERNVNLRRSITQMLTQHIEALDDVDRANVVVTMPERTTFLADQSPVTASVVIYQKPNSDILTNRKKIEGIQKLVRFAVEGLTDEYIVITDSSGNVINNFEDLADFDRVKLVEKEQQLIALMEKQYRNSILTALQNIFTADRVRDLNIKIDMDMSKRDVDAKEFSPITIREDNPDTPYDDSEFKDTLTVSSETSTTRWQGSGFDPEGPAGTTGQTPPVYGDMSNLYGLSEQSIVRRNEVVNERQIREQKSPSIDRVTVSVNIDGEWKIKYNETGRMVFLPNGSMDREYIPVDPADIAKAQELVQDAIGFNRSRGDSVTVRNIRFDRTAQFATEDAAYMRAQQTQRTILLILGGIAIILVAFIVFRVITRELERRRRLKEEELLRQHQIEREQPLWEAEQAGMEVSMSVEERKRLELQENAINMAKEHPEDVALLIRTWLMEE